MHMWNPFNAVRRSSLIIPNAATQFPKAPASPDENAEDGANSVTFASSKAPPRQTRLVDQQPGMDVARGAIRAMETELVRAQMEIQEKHNSLQETAETLAMVTAERDWLRSRLEGAAVAKPPPKGPAAPARPSRTPAQSLRAALEPLQLNSDSNLLNEFLDQVLDVQRCIDNHALDSRGHKLALRFGHAALDVSSIPPPSHKDASAVQEVAMVMLRARRMALKLRNSPADLDQARLALCGLEEAWQQQQQQDAIAPLIVAMRQLVHEGQGAPFDQDLGDRLSSLIRFHLRQALNPAGNFAAIFLGATSSRASSTSVDTGPETMIVASIFHRALWVVAEFSDDDAGLDDLVEYQGAKAFITSLVSAMNRISQVDVRRKLAWQMAQRWAGEAVDVAGQDLHALGLLSDVAALVELCNNSSKASTSQLARLLAQRPRLSQLPAQTLRALRVSHAQRIKFPTVKCAMEM